MMDTSYITELIREKKYAMCEIDNAVLAFINKRIDKAQAVKIINAKLDEIENTQRRIDEL